MPVPGLERWTTPDIEECHQQVLSMSRADALELGYNSREQTSIARFEGEQDRPILVEETHSRKDETGFIRTMYKRVDRKVKSANVPLPDGVKPEGRKEFTGFQNGV